MLPFVVIHAYYYGNNELKLALLGFRGMNIIAAALSFCLTGLLFQSYSFGDNWCRSFYVLEAVLVSQPTISEQRVE